MLPQLALQLGHAPLGGLAPGPLAGDQVAEPLELGTDIAQRLGGPLRRHGARRQPRLGVDDAGAQAGLGGRAHRQLGVQRSDELGVAGSVIAVRCAGAAGSVAPADVATDVAPRCGGALSVRSSSSRTACGSAGSAGVGSAVSRCRSGSGPAPASGPRPALRPDHSSGPPPAAGDPGPRRPLPTLGVHLWWPRSRALRQLGHQRRRYVVGRMDDPEFVAISEIWVLDGISPRSAGAVARSTPAPPRAAAGRRRNRRRPHPNAPARRPARTRAASARTADPRLRRSQRLGRSGPRRAARAATPLPARAAARIAAPPSAGRWPPPVVRACARIPPAARVPLPARRGRDRLGPCRSELGDPALVVGSRLGELRVRASVFCSRQAELRRRALLLRSRLSELGRRRSCCARASASSDAERSCSALARVISARTRSDSVWAPASSARSLSSSRTPSASFDRSCASSDSNRSRASPRRRSNSACCSATASVRRASSPRNSEWVASSSACDVARAVSSDRARSSATPSAVSRSERCASSACSAETVSLISASASGPARLASMPPYAVAGGRGTSGGAGAAPRGSASNAGDGSDVRRFVPTGGTGTDEEPTQIDAWPYSTGTAQSGTAKLASHPPGAGSPGSAPLAAKRWRRPCRSTTSSTSRSAWVAAVSRCPARRSVTLSPSPRVRSTRSITIGLYAVGESLISSEQKQPGNRRGATAASGCVRHRCRQSLPVARPRKPPVSGGLRVVLIGRSAAGEDDARDDRGADSGERGLRRARPCNAC